MYLLSDYFTFHPIDMDVLERHDVLNDVSCVCFMCYRLSFIDSTVCPLDLCLLS